MGRLVLRPTAERDTFTVYPASEGSELFRRSLYEGYAQIDLAEAGAVTSLDPGSRSTVYPGADLEVAFVRSGSSIHRNAELVLEGTRRDGIVQTDGPSLEMLITRWTAESISGTWESTACACTPSAAGYFLARRQR